MFNNEMLIFGGQYSYTDQVSSLTGCSLTRRAKLPFEFDYGACNVFEELGAISEAFVMLCFGKSGKTGCHRWTWDGAVPMDETNFEHYLTSLGNADGRPLALGSSGAGSGYHKYAEIMTQDLKWSLVENEFPFAEHGYYGYSAVSFRRKLYLFGGFGNLGQDVLNLASEYYEGNWTKLPDLKQKRAWHRSAIQDNKIIHVGGYPYDQNFEKWVFDGEKFDSADIKEYKSSLNSYSSYPELFWVDSLQC